MTIASADNQALLELFAEPMDAIEMAELEASNDSFAASSLRLIHSNGAILETDVEPSVKLSGLVTGIPGNGTTQPKRMSNVRVIKGTKSTRKASPIHARRFESIAEAENYIALTGAVIAQALADATPQSLIMDLTGQSATASPDVGAVYDAVIFFRTGRLEEWTNAAGSDPHDIRRRFEGEFKAWVEERGHILAKQVVKGVMDAMQGKASGLTPEGAGAFMRDHGMVNFWCNLAGVPPELLHSKHSENIARMNRKRSAGDHKVMDHKCLSLRSMLKSGMIKTKVRGQRKA